MNLNYKDYTGPFYVAPLSSSYGLYILISGHTNLGIFSLPTDGIQARLIGLIFLAFPLLLAYHLFFQIPQSLGKGKVSEIIRKFFIKPFFYTWCFCILLKFLSDYFQYGTLLFFGMIIICFFFQKDFNEEIIEIYNK